MAFLSEPGSPFELILPLSPGPPVELILALVAVWFVFIAWALSWMSGWRRLARDFGAEAEDRPESTRWLRKARLGWVSYDGCLWVGGDERGLYLRPFFLLRFSHRPLRVPWSEVRAWERKQLLFWSTDTLLLGRTGLRLRVPSSAMESLDPYLRRVVDGHVQTRLR